MYEKAIQLREDEYRFMAALQGVELPDPSEERVKEKIKLAEAKAIAAQTGISEEEYMLEGMFEFIDEE